MDHVAGPLHILLAEKREDLVLYNMSQTLPIWENYLVVFVCIGICFGSTLKYVMMKKYLKKYHGLPKLAPCLTMIPGDSETLSTVCHVWLHVTFHPWSPLWAFRPSPSCVKRTWKVSALSTNESSWIAMVMGLQCCVWSGRESGRTMLCWVRHIKDYWDDAKKR